MISDADKKTIQELSKKYHVKRVLLFGSNLDSSKVARDIDLAVEGIEPREFFDYYRTPRGQHPHSTTSYSFTSLAPMMNSFPFAQIETISPRPVLFIVGERAVSAYFSEDAYSRAAEPKELFVVPGASHVDLYDVPQYMGQSLKKLDTFFSKNL